MGTAGAGVDRTRPPAPDPVPELRLPEFRRFRLDGGLEVRVAERHDLPEVSLQLLVEAGASAEPSDRAGVAELAGRLLTEGAGSRDAMGVAEWLDRLGAVFHAAIRYDVATLSMHFLSEVTPGALDFLATVVREPRFDPEEVERVRKERLDEIERERDEPAIVADLALVEAIYGGDHLYGRSSGGDEESVSRLDRESVRAFHELRYGAAGAALVVCGDVRAEELRDDLERRFGGWGPGAGRPPPPEAPERPVGAGRVVLVDRPGSPQAEIRLGTVGMAYASPDLFPARVANAVLGGLFNSRLNMNLREEKGWTYGARTSFRFRRGPGPFVARTAVETAVTARAVSEILAEVEGLAERPPSDEEIRLAKNAMTLSLPLQFETNGQVSRKIARQLTYDLPDDYWVTYRDRVEAVRPEEILAVAERYLPIRQMAVVVVTDAASVRDELEELAPVEVRPAP